MSYIAEGYIRLENVTTEELQHKIHAAYSLLGEHISVAIECTGTTRGGELIFLNRGFYPLKLDGIKSHRKFYPVLLDGEEVEVRPDDDIFTEVRIRVKPHIQAPVNQERA